MKNYFNKIILLTKIRYQQDKKLLDTILSTEISDININNDDKLFNKIVDLVNILLKCEHGNPKKVIVDYEPIFRLANEFLDKVEQIFNISTQDILDRMYQSKKLIPGHIISFLLQRTDKSVDSFMKNMNALIESPIDFAYGSYFSLEKKLFDFMDNYFSSIDFINTTEEQKKELVHIMIKTQITNLKCIFHQMSIYVFPYNNIEIDLKEIHDKNKYPVVEKLFNKMLCYETNFVVSYQITFPTLSSIKITDFILLNLCYRNFRYGSLYDNSILTDDYSIMTKNEASFGSDLGYLMHNHLKHNKSVLSFFSKDNLANYFSLYVEHAFFNQRVNHLTASLLKDEFNKILDLSDNTEFRQCFKDHENILYKTIIKNIMFYNDFEMELNDDNTRFLTKLLNKIECSKINVSEVEVKTIMEEKNLSSINSLIQNIVFKDEFRQTEKTRKNRI